MLARGDSLWTDPAVVNTCIRAGWALLTFVRTKMRKLQSEGGAGSRRVGGSLTRRHVNAKPDAATRQVHHNREGTPVALPKAESTSRATVRQLDISSPKSRNQMAKCLLGTYIIEQYMVQCNRSRCSLRSELVLSIVLPSECSCRKSTSLTFFEMV